MKKTTIIIPVIALVIGFIAGSEYQKYRVRKILNNFRTEMQSAIAPATQESNITPKQPNIPTNNLQQNTAPAPAPKPIDMSGKGQQATEAFTLGEGLAVFKMNNAGKGYFSVWLLDNKGNNLDLLANGSDNFEGSKAIKIEQSGEYRLNITSFGNWTVKIEQSR